jgi:hypothetical protein
MAIERKLSDWDVVLDRPIAAVPPSVPPAKHTGVTEPTPRYEDLKAQLEYAEQIIRRIYEDFRNRQRLNIISDPEFSETLTTEMARLYLAGAKTPAEFVKAQAGEKP